MPISLSGLAPQSMRGYQRAWLGGDLLAGVTLAAIAIPEVMGYTSIAQTPIVTGLYTVIFPTLMFVLLGSSRLLVVGADSATAALLAAGLGAAAIDGVTPGSAQWLAYAGVIAILTGLMLLLARVLRMGFLGDFLSASVLVGFLSGVGIQVASGQLPDMIGVDKGQGGWLDQQVELLVSIPKVDWPTLAFALVTIALIVGFKRLAPKVPGAIVAVVLLTTLSTLADAAGRWGVAVVGPVPSGFPPIGLPDVSVASLLPDLMVLASIAVGCAILIIAQSAATSRSFAMKHGQTVDVNRDIVGLTAANLAAGLSGTFVVNGSPTKTQILDEQHGRTQLANLTMSVITLLIALFFTQLLADMPKAVLAGIVFMIGVDLVDLAGLRMIRAARQVEFWIAIGTGVVVCAVGVEQGIIVAVIVSILNLVRRQYSPRRFVVGMSKQGQPTYATAERGLQSAPGLVIFRYDAELFYANANRFVDDLEDLIEHAPTPVEWLILDASSLDDIDYTASRALGGLLDYLAARNIVLALARIDPSIVHALDAYGLSARIGADRMYGNLNDAYQAFVDRQPATN